MSHKNWRRTTMTMGLNQNQLVRLLGRWAIKMVLRIRKSHIIGWAGSVIERVLPARGKRTDSGMETNNIQYASFQFFRANSK
jgi:hypothetical protein